jgi:hypothetical protein
MSEKWTTNFCNLKKRISNEKRQALQSFVVSKSRERSLQCPPNSCRNPVIPAESCGMKFGRKACYFFHSGVLLFQRNDRIPEWRPECSAEFTGTECDGIRLFVWHILFVYFTPVAKQTQHCSLPPPTILFAAPSIRHHPPSMARTTVTTTTTTMMRHRPTTAMAKNDGT